MSTPNPFNNALWDQIGPGPVSRKTVIDLSISGTEGLAGLEPPNPFNETLPDYKTQVDAPSKLGSFAGGVKEGLLHPIRALVPAGEEEERPDGWTLGNTIAEVAGEFAGFGISFLPFLKATQFGLKGLGFGMRAGQFLRTPGFAIAEGGISGALFEMGSDLTDDPLTRMGIGGVTGAAFDAILVGAAKGWRGRFPKEIAAPGPITDPARLLRGTVGTVDPHPAAVALERNLHPEGAKSFEEAIVKMRFISDEREQLEIAAARVAAVFRPLGVVELTGIESPGKAMRALKKALPDSELTLGPQETKIGQKPLYTIEVRDTKPRDRLELASKEMNEFITAFMKGEKPALTYDEAIAMVSRSDMAEPGVPVTKATKKEIGEEYRKRGGKEPGDPAGFADRDAGDIWMHDTNKVDPHNKFSTLVHEFTHHFSFWRADAMDEATVALGGKGFGPGRRPENVLEILYGKPSKELQGLSVATRTEIGKEMEEATITVLMKKWKISRSSAESVVGGAAQKDYYHQGNEQISRLAELMFLAPDEARQIAPLSTKLFSEQILLQSPKLEMLLTKTEHRMILRQLKGLWIKEGDRTRIFKMVQEEYKPIHRVQYQNLGYHEGMEVFVEGKPMHIVKVGKGPGKPLTVKEAVTGIEREILPWMMHKPVMSEQVLRNKGIIERVKGMLSKPPEWLGVVLRDGKTVDEAATAGKTARAKALVEQKYPELKGVMTPEDFVKKIFDGEGGHKAFQGTAAESAMLKAAGFIEDLQVPINGAPQPLGHLLTIDGEALLKDATTTPVMRNAVRRAVVKLKDFDRATSVDEWWTQNKVAHQNVLRRFFENPPEGEMTPELIIKEILKDKGSPGLVVNDGGRYMVFVADEKKLILSPEQMAERWVKTVDGEVGSPWIEPGVDNTMESILLEAGVSGREIEYFKKLNPFEDLLGEVAREEGLMSRIMHGAAVARSEEIKHGAQESIGIAAERAGIRSEVTMEGEIRLLSDTGEEVFRTSDEDAARNYINQIGPDLQMEVLDAGSPIPTSGAVPPPQVKPPRPFEQIPDTFSSRVLDGTQLFLSVFTAMENFAKSAERRGLGAAYTRVFRPVQEALKKVDHQLRFIKHDLLQGRTFQEQVKLIEDLSKKVQAGRFGRGAVKRQELTVKALETLSREEVAAPGGLLKRGMNEKEIAIADTLRGLGVQDDIPRLTGLLKMAKLAVRNKGELAEKLMRYDRVELSPEFRAGLDALKAEFDALPDNVPDILRNVLGLNESQMTAAGLIDNVVGADKDDLSIFAIGRYASAKYEKGSGREAFMKEQGFNGVERKLVTELERAYEAAFAISNLNAKREIGGYWPHMRKWIEHGFKVEDEFIAKHLPDSVEWSAQRVNTGELDVYLMDPVLTTYKHIRGMLMKQEFDPLLPDVKDALKGIGVRSERAHRILSEYMHEAMGRPHASFRKLHDMIAMSTKIMTGKTPNPEFTRNLVNGIGALANAAAIPFRPMLILRNYYQIPSMIGPRVGIGDLMEGLRRAMSAEGFKEMTEKGIVTHNVLPIHASTELYGYDTSRFNRRLQHIFAKGFEWYQKPDDIGRATAAFAMRSRISRFESQFQTGKITWAEFKAKAKINTFDSADVDKFEELWKAGRFDDAKDWMGARLAEETIFRYGRANHPAGWGSVAGRLYGTFGTWPTQYKDFLMQGMLRGSTRDRMEFLATHSAINASMLATGAAFGVDLMSWVTFPSLNYTGGPLADLTISTIQAWGGSPQEKSMAKRNIRGMFPTLEDPRSIFLPGSYFLGDLKGALTAESTDEMLTKGLGLRELRHSETNPFAGVWD